MRERVEDLQSRVEKAFNPGSERSVQRQHDRLWKVTQRLLDPEGDDTWWLDAVVDLTCGAYLRSAAQAASGRPGPRAAGCGRRRSVIEPPVHEFFKFDVSGIVGVDD